MEQDNKLPVEGNKPATERLKDYWPIITIFMIIVGYLFSYIYYEFFHVNIFPYLDLTDIFQIQFRFYTFLILGILLTSILTLIVNVNSGIKNITNIKPKLNFEYILFSLNIDTIKSILYAILIGLALLMIGLLSAFASARNILNGNAEKEVILILEKSVVKTDKNNMFIGQTKNYIFFYNRISEQSTIYKTADAKEIIISKGVDHSNEK